MAKYISNASVILESLNKNPKPDVKSKTTQLKDKVSDALSDGLSAIDKAKNNLVDKLTRNDKIKKNKQNQSKALKEYFMETAIGVIFDRIMEDNHADYRDYNIGHNIIHKFVEEQGYSNLMTRFHSQNLILSEMANIIDEYYNIAIKEATKETLDDQDLGYTLDKTIAADFVEKIKDLVPEKCIKMIYARVTDSVQNFIDQQTERKIAIKDIYIKANEKAKQIKADSVREDFISNTKAKVSKVYNKSTNVFGAMTQILSENAYKNDALKALYINESGELNTKQICNDAMVMYTVLEEINTLQMADITDDFIRNELKKMKL